MGAIGYEKELNLLPAIEKMQAELDSGSPANLGALLHASFKSSKADCSAPLVATRKAIEDKTKQEVVCPRCNGSGVDPMSPEPPEPHVVCKQCKGEKTIKHPWHGKKIKWQPEQVRIVKRDGRAIVQVTQQYEVV